MHVSATGGFVSCPTSEGSSSDILSHLPRHPSNTHEDHHVVLPSTLVDLVAAGHLQLPSDPDRNIVYVQEAQVQGRGHEPFVRAVWFTPDAADEITGQVAGSHANSQHRVWERWVASHTSDSAACTHAQHSFGGVRPMSGSFTELGVGVLAGGGRTSITLGEERSGVPFARNPTCSTRMEPALGEFMSDVSCVLHEVLPAGVMHAHEVPSSCPLRIACAYQYPRLRTHTPPLASHQVVIRGPRSGEPDEDRVGATLAAGADHADLAARDSISDLHVDPWDGGGALGTCTVHTCQRWSHDVPDVERECELLQLRGLVVFPFPFGGRGVLVHSMVPGWHCAILMRTSHCLHGGVLPCGMEVAGLALSHLRMMRIITYPLSRIETLLRRLAEAVSRGDSEAVRVLYSSSDAWVRERMDRMDAL